MDTMTYHQSTNLPHATLLQLLKAGEQVRHSMAALEKAGLNIVGECLKGQGAFYEFSHYPEDDVYDKDSKSQYYFHTHRGLAGEYGHFHTFLRSAGMPSSVVALEPIGTKVWPSGEDALSHLIAISMNQEGIPVGLFTTNRWVTGERWYQAEDVVQMLDAFVVDHAFPNLAVNQWISAMFRLFKYEMVGLLLERDRVVNAWCAQHPNRDVFEARELEVTSFQAINIDQKINQIKSALSAPERNK